MDEFLVDGDEIELVPDPPWNWMAGPVKLPVQAMAPHKIKVEGKSVILEADILMAALQGIGQAYSTPGFDAPGTVVKLDLLITKPTLSESVTTDAGQTIATVATEGTFIAAVVPAMNPSIPAPDPAIPKTGTWKIASKAQTIARSGSPKDDDNEGNGAGGLVGGRGGGSGGRDGGQFFFAVDVKDTTGEPLAGQKVKITTADGQQFLKTLDKTGSARVDGIRQEDGVKVEVIDFDADLRPPGFGGGAHFIAIEVVDPDGKPLTGGKVSVTLPSGERFLRSLGPDGAFRLDGLTEVGAAIIKLVEGDLVVPADGEQRVALSNLVLHGLRKGDRVERI